MSFERPGAGVKEDANAEEARCDRAAQQRRARNPIAEASCGCTRVGSGPFPTEQENEVGQKLRDEGFLDKDILSLVEIIAYQKQGELMI